MGHYAYVLDGTVQRVIVAEENGEFITQLKEQTDEGQWLQTSYNTYGGVHYDPETQEPDDGEPIRKNFAAKGMKYDAEADAFHSPQPHPSWTLNQETFLWEPPTPRPDDGNLYEWDEETESWVQINTQS